MKLAVRVGLLTTLFVGACHCPKAHERVESGRWQLSPGPGNYSWMLTDTATGRVWEGYRTDPREVNTFTWHDLGVPGGTK
jgi:hypothetical protein